MIGSIELFCFLLLATFSLIHRVVAQTACQDFGTGLITDYPNWSQAHIQTWCNDHDLASTGQCAREWPSSQILLLANGMRSCLVASKPTLSEAKEVSPPFPGMVVRREAFDRHSRRLYRSLFFLIHQHYQQQQWPQRSCNVRSVQFWPSS